MSRSLVAPALAVLTLALSVGAFFASCEQHTKEVYTGFQGEARANRYLAAERLLAAMGAEVHSGDGIDALDPLPETDAILILAVDRSALGGEVSRRLLDWASRGGHLVVVSWSLWDDEERTADLVLDPLGVEQYMHEPPDKRDDAVEEPEIARIDFPGRDALLRASFDPRFYLVIGEQVEPRLRFMDRNGTHLVTLRVGRGLVTALSDDWFLSNQTIHLHHHAELLWRLARLDGRAGAIWVIWSARYPGAWTLLLRHGWMVLTSLVVLLCAWLWYASRRFGPVEPDAPLERRQLMEHIEAAGRFELRGGNQRALLDSVRQAVRTRIRSRHPGWLTLVPAELHARLAARAGIARQQVDRALAYGESRDRERFARRIATLEKIRKAL